MTACGLSRERVPGRTSSRWSLSSAPKPETLADFVTGHIGSGATLKRSRYFRTEGQPDISMLIRRLSVKAKSPVIGRSFQGHAAVRRLTPADHQVLVQYAQHLPLEPAGSPATRGEKLEARIHLGDPDAVSSLITTEAPGIADERRRYLFEQTPRRNPQHVQELRKLYEGKCKLCGMESQVPVPTASLRSTPRTLAEPRW